MKLSSVLANNPALGEAIRSDDIDRLAQMLF